MGDVELAQRLAAIVDSSDDAIISKSANGVITSWNAGAERLYGYAAGEAIGRPVGILVPEERAGEEQMILDRTLAGEKVEHYETERVRKDGGRIWVSLTVSPLRDSAGHIVGASVIARDVSRRWRLDEQRRRLQAVTAALSEAVTLEQVVAVVLKEGLAAVGASAGVVAVEDEAGEWLEVLGMAGVGEETVERWPRVPVDADLPLAEAFRTRQPIWLADPATVRARYRTLLDPSLQGGRVIAPLSAHSRCLGALGLSFGEAIELNDDDRDFVVALAQQCAQALERARLFEAERTAREAAERAQRRLALLADAGALLGASLDPESTLEQVARLTVPAIADWAFVEMLRDDGSIERVAITHSDPAREGWARELAERYPLDPDSPYGSPQVIRTGEPELTADIPDELLQEVAIDAEHLRILREVGFKSAMVVPLRARGRVLGDIALVSAESGRRFGEEDLRLAQELADRCALAVDNARLFAERSYVAQTLQQGLLPPELPDIPAVEIAVRYRAGERSSHVGGDFYDVFPAQRGWTFVTGDVVGKGPRAAATTGLVRHTIRTAALYEQQPSEVLRGVNSATLDQLAEDEFCTVVCAHLDGADTGARLTVCAAGHPLPLRLTAAGTVARVGEYGQAIGVLGEPELADAVIALDAGDSVVLYTDGVTDARGRGGTFGEQRLRALLAMCAGMPPAQIADRIERAVLAFEEGPRHDDLAILVLRVKPSPER